MAMQQSSGPFAAGNIAAPRPTTSTYRAIEAPRPFWDQVESREQRPSPEARMAAEEARMQGALWDRHRQVEALVGRRVPTSTMMTGQNSLDGFGGLSDVDYEARIEAMRREYPDQLSGVESRADIAARLSGQPAITFYETSHGPAQAITRQDGSLWLETNDGYTGPLSRFPGARPVRRAAAADVTQGDGAFAGPRVRSLGERFTSTLEDMAHTNPIMALGRWAVGGGYDEYEDPETGQTVRYASFGQQARDQERERRDAYRMMAAGDPWDGGHASLLHKLARGAVTLTGAVAGSAADPTSLVAPGEGVVGRIVGGVAVNAVGDAVTQGADIGSGIQDHYDPMQTVTAAAIGGVIQGGLEGAGAAGRRLSGNPGGVAEALADEIDLGTLDLTRPLSPEARAALARIDADRLDIARIGRVGGEAYQAAASALDRSEAPPTPARDATARFDIEIGDGADGPTFWVRPDADTTASHALGDDDFLFGWVTDDALRIERSALREGARGQGLGLAMYERAAREALESGRRLVSDSEVSVDAQRVWAALERRGYVVERSPTVVERGGDLTTNDGMPVFSVQRRDRPFNDRHPVDAIEEIAADRPDLHASMVDLLRDAAPRSDNEARAVVQEARLADFAESTGIAVDLFAGAPDQAAVIARARLRASVMDQVRQEPRLFSALTRDADAIEAGGHALARTVEEGDLALDLVAGSAVERLSLRVGQAPDTFGEVARAISRGQMAEDAGARAVVDELRRAADLSEAARTERRALLDPSRPSQASIDALRAFDEPGGKARADQTAPKPEDADREAALAAQWDDLPEVGEEQRALDILRVCAPGKA